jgi:hypothetical protein
VIQVCWKPGTNRTLLLRLRSWTRLRIKIKQKASNLQWKWQNWGVLGGAYRVDEQWLSEQENLKLPKYNTYLHQICCTWKQRLTIIEERQAVDLTFDDPQGEWPLHIHSPRRGQKSLLDQIKVQHMYIYRYVECIHNAITRVRFWRVCQDETN